MENVLQVEHLHKSFSSDSCGEILAVNDVSFAVGVGEKVAIIGESGSGKTTVARLVTRLLDAASGRILLDGVDITRARGSERKRAYRKMQMVFQSPVDSFDPRCTLGNSIAEGLVNYGMKEEQAQEETARLLELCGLVPDFAFRYPHEVSGGQCQRAAIARALACKPRLLILDEATSALDVTVQAEILALLNRLQRELAMSYLFICHDIALVQDFCDRVLVMHRGRIVEEGPVDAVIRHPQTAYTQMLIRSVL